MNRTGPIKVWAGRTLGAAMNPANDPGGLESDQAGDATQEIAMQNKLMAYVNIKIQDRPAGQPASPESIERDQRFSVKAEEIAKLKALRLANLPDSTPVAKRGRPSKPAASD